MLKNVLGFVEHQEKSIYVFGYELTLSKNKDEAVLEKAGVIANARSKIDFFPWYAPHFTTRCCFLSTTRCFGKTNSK